LQFAESELNLGGALGYATKIVDAVVGYASQYGVQISPPEKPKTLAELANLQKTLPAFIL